LKRTKFALGAAAAVVALTAVASVGAMTRTSTAAVKVAVVTDIGGLNDRSFNQAANAGRLMVQKQLKVPTRVWDTKSAADRVPNLQSAAQAGYNLVFATGFFMTDPLSSVAPAFPNTKFAGIDVDQGFITGKPANVRGLLFREQEAGYLAGYIAGLTLKQQPGPDVASAIGANTVPPIVRYMAGYKAGVLKALPSATVLTDYANDPTFSDQAKCRETALNQIDRGTQIIFQIAGGCGLGALDAAKQKGLWGIGVDVDQGYLGSFMLTSALKNIATAVLLTSTEFKKNPATFKTGFNMTFTVKNGGIGYGKVSMKLKNRAAIIKKTEVIRKLIAAGKIVVPAA
jgi:basic membrane protein A